MITYYENIRSSLISEENIIQNYLDIYQLLKINGIPKKDIFNTIKRYQYNNIIIIFEKINIFKIIK